jgi:hypothetical protein
MVRQQKGTIVWKNYKKSIHQIQENIKIEDGYHAITSKVKNVIEEVGSMQEKNEHGLSLEK